MGSAFATTDWTIVASTAEVQGVVFVNDAAVAGSNKNTISFVASANLLGIMWMSFQDGTNWYVSELGVTADLSH